MLVNKWVLFALSLIAVVVAYLGTVDWQTLAPSQAGAILMAIAVVKAIVAAVMPPASQKTITAQPAAGGIVTHT
jgi:hypothetical protein